MLTTHLAMSGALVEHIFKLYAPAAKVVQLIGEMTDWQAAPLPMQSEADGHWQIRLQLRHGQWLYKFIVDGEIIADPANPLRAADGLGGHQSYLLLGEGDWARRPGIAYGQIVRLSFFSQWMGEETSFELYLPPGYDLAATQSYSLLYLMHGYRTQQNQWASNGLIANFMGNLQAQARLPPFIIVMPATTSRDKAQRYGTFLAEELYAWLARHFPLAQGPQHVAVAGMSQFSLNAFDLAWRYPQRFGFCLPVSAFYSEQYLQQLPSLLQARTLDIKPGLRIYCGSEDYVYARNERFAAILREHQIPFTYLRVPGEHSWHYWNSMTRDLLLAVGDFFQRAATPTNHAAAQANGQIYE